MLKVSAVLSELKTLTECILQTEQSAKIRGTCFVENNNV